MSDLPRAAAGHRAFAEHVLPEVDVLLRVAMTRPVLLADPQVHEEDRVSWPGAPVPSTPDRRIEKHLEHCRRCGLEARTYREIKSTLSRRGAPVDPAAAARLTAFGQSLLAAGGDRPDDEGPV